MERLLTDTRGKPVTEIMVNGKRWFDKVNGNTYHSSCIYVNGHFFDKVQRQYGYGDHYITTAFDLLQSVGLVTLDRPTQAPWSYCQDNGIRLYTEVSDITRKGDL